MSEPKPARTIAESLVEMTEIVLPEDTNPRGSIFGGRVLALIDKCAAVVAMRHSRLRTVTVALDSVVFLSPVRVGDVLLLSGRINAAFDSSMEIEVKVGSEDPLSGRRRLTTTAFVTMVGLDSNGRPQHVPALRLLDDAEREREHAAADRRKTRLARRSSRSGG